MAIADIALMARARGVAMHLATRATLDALAAADTLSAFARALARLDAMIEPIDESLDVFAIESAIGRTASRHLRTLYRWQERRPGALDIFTAFYDRRSLRALLRGVVQGAPPQARLAGLLPTPSLPLQALTVLAHQPSPAAVVAQLSVFGHADAPRLRSLVQRSQVDLLAIDAALLGGFAERATRAAAIDRRLREFVSMSIDVSNLQNAIALASEPRDVDPQRLFVAGGRWLAKTAFASAANGSPQHALTTLTTALASSPLAPLLPVVASELVNLDRTFLTVTLQRLRRDARVAPLSHAPLLRVLLLIAAQTRDLQTLMWGAALGTPTSLRKQQLVTPA